MSKIFLVQVAGTTLSLDNQVILLAVGSGFDNSADIVLNTAHREIIAGNPHGTSKGDTGLGDVTNDAQLKRSAGDYQVFPQKVSPVGADSLLGEDSADGENKKRITLTGIYNYFLGLLVLVFARITNKLDHGAVADDVTINATTATNHYFSAALGLNINVEGLTESNDTVKITAIAGSTLTFLVFGYVIIWPPNQTQTLTGIVAGTYDIMLSLDTETAPAEAVIRVQQTKVA